MPSTFTPTPPGRNLFPFNLAPADLFDHEAKRCEEELACHIPALVRRPSTTTHNRRASARGGMTKLHESADTSASLDSDGEADPEAPTEATKTTTATRQQSHSPRGSHTRSQSRRSATGSGSTSSTISVSAKNSPPGGSKRGSGGNRSLSLAPNQPSDQTQTQTQTQPQTEKATTSTASSTEASAPQSANHTKHSQEEQVSQTTSTTNSCTSLALGPTSQDTGSVNSDTHTGEDKLAQTLVAVMGEKKAEEEIKAEAGTQNGHPNDSTNPPTTTSAPSTPRRAIPAPISITDPNDPTAQPAKPASASPPSKLAAREGHVSDAMSLPSAACVSPHSHDSSRCSTPCSPVTPRAAALPLDSTGPGQKKKQKGRLRFQVESESDTATKTDGPVSGTENVESTDKAESSAGVQEAKQTNQDAAKQPDNQKEKEKHVEKQKSAAVKKKVDRSASHRRKTTGGTSFKALLKSSKESEAQRSSQDDSSQKASSAAAASSSSSKKKDLNRMRSMPSTAPVSRDTTPDASGRATPTAADTAAGSSSNNNNAATTTGDDNNNSSRMVNGVIYITIPAEVSSKKQTITISLPNARDLAKEKREREEAIRARLERQAERDRKKAEEREKAKEAKRAEMEAAKEASRMARERMKRLLVEQAIQRKKEAGAREKEKEAEAAAAAAAAEEKPGRQQRTRPRVREVVESEHRRKMRQEMDPNNDHDTQDDQPQHQQSGSTQAQEDHKSDSKKPSSSSSSFSIQFSIPNPAPRRGRKLLIPDRLVAAAKKGDLEELRESIREEFGSSTKPSSSSHSSSSATNKEKETRMEFMNRVDKNGSSVLFHAAWPGHVSFIRHALQYGADPDVQNMRRNTAMHLAVERGHDQVVLELLRFGANPTLKNQLGLMPATVLGASKEIMAASAFAFVHLENMWKKQNPAWIMEEHQEEQEQHEEDATHDDTKDEANPSEQADIDAKDEDGKDPEDGVKRASDHRLSSSIDAGHSRKPSLERQPSTGSAIVPEALLSTDPSDVSAAVTLPPSVPQWLRILKDLFLHKGEVRAHTKKMVSVVKMTMLRRMHQAHTTIQQKPEDETQSHAPDTGRRQRGHDATAEEGEDKNMASVLRRLKSTSHAASAQDGTTNNNNNSSVSHKNDKTGKKSRRSSLHNRSATVSAAPSRRSSGQFNWAETTDQSHSSATSTPPLHSRRASTELKAPASMPQQSPGHVGSKSPAAPPDNPSAAAAPTTDTATVHASVAAHAAPLHPDAAKPAESSASTAPTPTVKTSSIFSESLKDIEEKDKDKEKKSSVFSMDWWKKKE